MLRDLKLSQNLNDLVIEKDLKWQAEPQSILQYIILFFTTERGSLPLSPSFGTNIKNLLFQAGLTPDAIKSEINAEIEMLYRILPVLRQKIRITPIIDEENKKMNLAVFFIEYNKKAVLRFKITEEGVTFLPEGGENE